MDPLSQYIRMFLSLAINDRLKSSWNRFSTHYFVNSQFLKAFCVNFESLNAKENILGVMTIISNSIHRYCMDLLFCFKLIVIGSKTAFPYSLAIVVFD